METEKIKKTSHPQDHVFEDLLNYNRLADKSILNEARPEAEKIYVGKASSHHTLEQEMINHLLIQKAREGKVVIRLKGGDPFVLG